SRGNFHAWCGPAAHTRHAGFCKRLIVRCMLKEAGSMARIRHIAILTEDVERLVRFYTTAFGLKVVEGVGTATYLTDGHLNLAIIPIGPEREIEGGHLKEGINHFGFEVDSVDSMVPVCRQWGASTEVEKRPPNREAEFRVYDPDGNPIDLSQHGWPH